MPITFAYDTFTGAYLGVVAAYTVSPFGPVAIFDNGDVRLTASLYRSRHAKQRALAAA